VEYLDVERFKNHDRMYAELLEAGALEEGPYSEAELIHIYDITFLVGRYDLVVESRTYMPKGTRTRTVR
jgi:hypothetical protein